MQHEDRSSSLPCPFIQIVQAMASSELNEVPFKRIFLPELVGKLQLVREWIIAERPLPMPIMRVGFPFVANPWRPAIV